jgi:hypothetical protein
VDAVQLRAVQAPLKAHYRADPASAVITLQAEGELGAEQVTCSVTTGRALVEAGLHPATGGDGSFACSGDMLLHALVGCAGVTLLAVATNRGIPVSGGCAPRLQGRSGQHGQRRGSSGRGRRHRALLCGVSNAGQVRRTDDVDRFGLTLRDALPLLWLGTWGVTGHPEVQIFSSDHALEATEPC